ncbi:MAG: DUF11 domain-containing protein [Gammaproteobacteria bacterium]|nr:DUF11 domain-containing protein [Gammaproteobacteria bacterium]
MMAAGSAHAFDLLVNHDVFIPDPDATIPYGSMKEVVGGDASGPAGGKFAYVAKVILNQTPAATDVKLVEKLPVGVTLDSVVFEPAGAGACDLTSGEISAGNQEITCNLDDGQLTNQDDTVAVRFNVTIPTVGNNWRAYASASADQSSSDSDPTNETNIPRNITTYTAADVGLVVEGSDEYNTNDDTTKIPAGTPYTQTVKVTNHGPVDIPSAGRVVVSFEVGTGGSVTGITGTGWTCSYDPTGLPAREGTQVSCARSGALAVNEAAPDLVVTGTADAPDVQVTHGYEVKAYQTSGINNPMPDGNPDNNTGSSTVHTKSEASADMTVTKTRNGSSMVALGEETTFIIKPRLLGGFLPEGAVVKVEDSLPGGLTLVSMTADSPWSCSDSDSSCNYTVPAGGVSSYNDLPVITVIAKVTKKGDQTNSAEVSITSGATDPVSGNNTDGAKVTGSNGSDLSLSKTASNYQNGINVAVQVGDTYQYTLRVTNNGPLAIPAAGGDNPPVVITETLPVGVTVEDTHTANDWTCTGLPATGATTFTCTHSGGFADGQTRSLILNAKRTTEGNAKNEACVAFGSVSGTPTREDDKPGNNCAGVDVGASNTDPNEGNQADLEIIKTASGDVYAGENLTYTFVIKNNGPKDSENVVLYDKFDSLVPTGVSLVGITGLKTDQTCTPTAGATGTSHTLNCQLGTLANGAEQTITVTVRPNVAEVGEDRGNTAFIYSNTTYDHDSNNNSSTITSRVTARVNLVASKVVATSEGGTGSNNKSAAAGSLMRYTVTATNQGPSSAENVWLRDTLPAGAILVGTPTVSDGTCRVVKEATGGADVAPDMTAGELQPAGDPGGVLECVWGVEGDSKFLVRNGNRQVNYDLRSVPVAAPGSGGGTELPNTVRVGTKTNEPDKSDNEATAEVTLTEEELDVLINMGHSKDALDLTAADGDKETEYTITVKNTGPTYATNMVMTDVFPGTLNIGGIEYPSTAVFEYLGNISVTSKVGSGSETPLSANLCEQPDVGALADPAAATPLQLECSFPLVAPDEVITIKFKMRAHSLPDGRSTGTIFHNATVKVDEKEWKAGLANPYANNDTEDRTSVRLNSTVKDPEVADLALVKTDNTDPANDPLEPGAAVTYTLTVTNHGPEASTNAVVTDVLPKGLDYVSGGSYDADTRTVTFDVGTLAKEASKDFVIEATIADPYNGTAPLVNMACVKGEGDPNPGNDCGEVKTPVKPPLKPTPVPVDNPLALLALILGMGWIARRFHMRKHA